MEGVLCPVSLVVCGTRILYRTLEFTLLHTRCYSFGYSLLKSITVSVRKEGWFSFEVILSDRIKSGEIGNDYALHKLQLYFCTCPIAIQILLRTLHVLIYVYRHIDCRPTTRCTCTTYILARVQYTHLYSASTLKA